MSGFQDFMLYGIMWPGAIAGTSLVLRWWFADPRDNARRRYENSKRRRYW